MKRVLIISYYWPPAGGAGVQRWLKMVKYLNESSIEPIVLTVDEKFASYIQTDTSLLNDVPKGLRVVKTKSIEPISWYSKIVGKGNVPTAGFSNVDNTKNSQRLINFIRSNFFVPDPRRGWNFFAFKEAKKLINELKIDVVITTSPPHSSQLIGLKLKRELGIKWITDLRDPWTDIYYYKILGHTYLSSLIDRHYERKVIENCDLLITVSESLKDLFIAKSNAVKEDKVFVVPNGFDHEDLEGIVKKENKNRFVITYTGTMSDDYEPEVFFDVLKTLKEKDNLPVKLQIVGAISKRILNYIKRSDIDFEFISTVPHDKVLYYQKNADLLLLVIPNVENSKGILTGKIFEYLGSLNPIFCLGEKDGDAASLISKCQAGETFARTDKKEMIQFILAQHSNKIRKRIPDPNKVEINKLSRRSQADLIGKLIID